jgi:hypothetical protein
MTDIYAFEQEAVQENERSSTDLSIEMIRGRILTGTLTEDQMWAILDAFPQAPSGIYPAIRVDDKEGEDVNLEREINEQLRMLRRMRTKLAEGDRAGSDHSITFRDIKEVISACSTVTNSLMRFHKDAKTIERGRAVEEATIAAIEEVAKQNNHPELPVLFVKLLKEALERL